MTTQITVQPVIPARLLEGIEGAMLKRLLDHEVDGDGNIYFFSREDIQTTVLLESEREAAELLKLAREGGTDSARSLSQALESAVEHLAADPTNFYEFDVNMNLTLDGKTFQVDHIDLLADLARKNPDDLPEIQIMGAFTEHKMRPGNFGGLAVLITPTSISEVDTHGWMAEQIRRKREMASPDAGATVANAEPTAAAAALDWILLEALEISSERIQGLSAEDATSEAASLSHAVALLKTLGADTTRHEASLQDVHAAMALNPRVG